MILTGRRKGPEDDNRRRHRHNHQQHHKFSRGGTVHMGLGVAYSETLALHGHQYGHGHLHLEMLNTRYGARFSCSTVICRCLTFHYVAVQHCSVAVNYVTSVSQFFRIAESRLNKNEFDLRKLSAEGSCQWLEGHISEILSLLHEYPSVILVTGQDNLLNKAIENHLVGSYAPQNALSIS